MAGLDRLGWKGLSAVLQEGLCEMLRNLSYFIHTSQGRLRIGHVPGPDVRPKMNVTRAMLALHLKGKVAGSVSVRLELRGQDGLKGQIDHHRKCDPMTEDPSPVRKGVEGASSMSRRKAVQYSDAGQRDGEDF